MCIYIITCRCTIEKDMTVVDRESTVSEQPVTDVIVTTSLDNKPATTVAKTRKKLAAKTNPMVAIAVDSTSKPPVAPTLSPLKRQNDMDKQFLANSLKVCCVYIMCMGMHVAYFNYFCLHSNVCIYLCVTVCLHAYK